MKKITVTLCIVFAFILGSAAGAADFTKDIKVTIYPNLQMFFNGTKDTDEGSNGMYFNGDANVPKTLIYEGTTYVPLRYFANKLGIPDDEIGWEGAIPAIWVGGKKPEALKGEVHNLDTAAQVIQKLGEPVSINVEGKKIKNYVYEDKTIMLYNDIVRQITSNHKNFKYRDFYIGMTLDELKALPYGKTFNSCGQIPECYGHVMEIDAKIDFRIYDGKIEYLQVESFMFDSNIEVERYTYDDTQLARYNRGFENRVLLLINGHRSQKGLPPLSWDNEAYDIAKGAKSVPNNAHTFNLRVWSEESSIFYQLLHYTQGGDKFESKEFTKAAIYYDNEKDVESKTRIVLLP